MHNTTFTDAVRNGPDVAGKVSCVGHLITEMRLGLVCIDAQVSRLRIDQRPKGLRAAANVEHGALQ